VCVCLSIINHLLLAFGVSVFSLRFTLLRLRCLFVFEFVLFFDDDTKWVAQSLNSVFPSLKIKYLKILIYRLNFKYKIWSAISVDILQTQQLNILKR
jgi:hypothetical protein